jgi:chromosomal replication initiation ATPase DnaA
MTGVQVEVMEEIEPEGPDAVQVEIPLRQSPRREERNVELCECMIDIAAALYGVPSRELRSQGRASNATARVRQIAMYVCHVILGLSMSEVGRGFGRDRTTVMHACHLIEDMRDDAEFDGVVALAERVADAALRRRRQV